MFPNQQLVEHFAETKENLKSKNEGKKMKKIFWFLCITVMTVGSVFAQLNTSSIIGTVAGPDGALIPGATVV